MSLDAPALSSTLACHLVRYAARHSQWYKINTKYTTL